MKKSIFALALLFLLYSLAGAQPASARDYYLAGIRAYQVQDCRNAVKWLKQALIEDPSLEYYDPDVKFKIGYCAFKIGDYETAKDFLKLYPNNTIARSILKAIEEGRKEEEWEKWLMVPEKEEKMKPKPSATPTEQVKRKISPDIKFYLLIAGVFAIVFTTVLFFEWRTGFITSTLVKMAGGRIAIERVEVPQEKVVKEIAKPGLEEVPEKEIDLEEIFNSSLDVVDRLIYGEEGFVSEEEVPAEEEGKKETEEKMEKAEPALTEEESSEKEAIIEELVEKGEIKESLTENDEFLVEKKAEELLKELEELEETMDIEEAEKTLEELVEELEEKDEYSPEDAKKFLILIEKTIKSYVEEESEG